MSVLLISAFAAIVSVAEIKIKNQKLSKPVNEIISNTNQQLKKTRVAKGKSPRVKFVIDSGLSQKKYLHSKINKQINRTLTTRSYNGRWAQPEEVKPLKNSDPDYPWMK